jgi:(2S)-methylsuccinyl-CoA dehydrogenase
VVDRTALEMRHTRKGIVGSNPTLSAKRPPTPSIPDLLDACGQALAAAERLVQAARLATSERIFVGGRVDPQRLEHEQYAAHGFAWLCTYVAALRNLLGWAQRLESGGGMKDAERLVVQIAFGEYLSQIAGGIPMSQSEIVRLDDIGVPPDAREAFLVPAVRRFMAEGNSVAARAALADCLAAGAAPRVGPADETLDMVRDQFRRFAEDRISPSAQSWHAADSLIPLELMREMAALGVFGLTIPQEFGGLDLGKVAMCVVTEELSRASLAVGSLATRSEIAAELIRHGGTDAQKAKWLPGIASGNILPTAVFTEPNTGSDLANVRTRAVRADGAYRVSGSKTWITHAARADVMTMLVRTGAPGDGYRGLSMLLAEKPRGSEEEPFPAAGMSGTEIKVLGYRGMKEYEISFDGFAVPVENLLGGIEGQGFKQLMATFESARIQTAARAVGVAQKALDLALSYANDRVQFGKPIAAFPRISGKLAWMAVETMLARQLTLAAAREKDGGRRCDIDAGMAKLLAARVAWANADAAVQVHGGNGYAEEFEASRILVDARILNIFEGAAEIQAQVIARGLLERTN